MGGGATLESRSGERGGGWPAAVLTLIAAVYLWEVTSLRGIPVARDMQMFFVPQKRLLWESFQAGAVPLWTPFIANGAPFLANLQSGVFYPPNWAYAVFPFYGTFNLLLVAHLAMGGVFAYLVCRRLEVGVVGAYVGAVSWMLGGYFASLLNLVNALQGAAWAPGLAWAALGVLERSDARRVAVLVGVAACAALAGEPQSFVLASLMSAVVCLLWLERRRPGRAELARMAGRVGLAALLVAGLVAIQLLPTLELAWASGRAGGLTYGEAAAFDLHPVRLLYLLVPPDYRDPEFAFGVRSIIGRGDPWLFSIYLGAAFPLLLYFAWRAGRTRPGTVVWSALAVAGVVVALGESTPVFAWLFEHVPGFAAFRFPEKYFFVTAFACLLLAARGADEALGGAAHRRDRWFAAAYVAVPWLGLGALHLGRETVHRWAMRWGNDRTFADFDYAFGVWSENLFKLALLAVLFVGLLWLRRRGHLSPRWTAILFATLVTADLAVAHRHLNPTVERAFYEEPPLVLRHVPLERIQRDYRYRASRFDTLAGTIPVLRGIPLEMQKWVWQQTMAPNVGQMWDVLQQDAWDAIKLPRAVDERDLHRAIPDDERRWRMLRLHSVRYVHSILRLEAEGEAVGIPLDTLPGHLYELRDPLPRAYVVEDVEWAADPVAAINDALAPSFDPRRAVVLVDSARARSTPAAREPPGASAGSGTTRFPGARILEADAHRVRIELDAPRGGYLVLTDSPYPGWTVRVDGEPRAIELGNFFFRAVRLEPGDREAVFDYRSRPFEIGRRVSVLTLAIGALAFGVAGWRARRRNGRSPAS